MHRGAVAEIDLRALSHNLGIIRKITGNTPVIAVVKADAYGHGSAAVSRKLAGLKVPFLAVAFTDEAIQLRDAGVTSPLIVLFDTNSIPDFFEYRLIPVIHDVRTAKRLSVEARRRKCTIDVHLKIDTGMGRMGLISERAVEEISAIANMESLRISGLMSHFSSADMADRTYAGIQLERFHAVAEPLRRALKKRGHSLLRHMANSAAVLSFRDAHLDAVRPGLLLYGYSPFPQPVGRRPLYTPKPVMKVSTRILLLRRVRRGTPISYGRTFVTKRESVIAVLPVGYADGYSRTLSNTMDVLVRGCRVPVVGRVCMDLTMVDVTALEAVKEGDEAVLLGRQGREAISAWDIAEKAGTIPYEILTSLGSRARKTFSD